MSHDQLPADPHELPQTRRKLCGTYWQSEIRSADSHHWCVRPVGHPDRCQCRCGAWPAEMTP